MKKRFHRIGWKVVSQALRAVLTMVGMGIVWAGGMRPVAASAGTAWLASGRPASSVADTAVFPFAFREAVADAPRVVSGDGAADGWRSAWAGGLNAAHIACLDLNGDGVDDLLVFDRNARKPFCFVYDGTVLHDGRDSRRVVAVGGGSYVYAPAYAGLLPPLQAWVQACDYNGDGLQDLFTFNGVAGIRVYRNVSHWETDENGAAIYRLRFEVLTDRLSAQMYGQAGDLYCIDVDYPAIVDVDGDGALDVLNFWVPSTGDYLHYYRNHALETYGTLDSFDLRIEDWSWGCFAENEESNGIYLDSCRPAGKMADKAHDSKHSGSTICALSRNAAAGRVYDLLLGDVDYDGLMYLYNGGTPHQAHITAYDSLFPHAEPVRLTSMPVVSVLSADVAAVMGWDTARGRTYLCMSPYSTDAFSTQGKNSLWIYEVAAGDRMAGSGTGGVAVSDWSLETDGAEAAAGWTVTRRQTDFLQADMVDLGALSSPVCFDYNGDGLLDLVVGYAGEPTGVAGPGGDACWGGLALYENIGTSTAPAFRFVTDDFLGLRRDGLRARTLCPAFGDYDGDGRPELVLGTYEGRLLAYSLDYTEGSAVSARLRDSLFLGLETSGSTAPVFFDIDRDGHEDLVVGGKQQMWMNAAGRRYTKSSLRFYRHSGRMDTAAGHPFVWMTDSLGGVDLIDRSFSNYGYARPAFYRPAAVEDGRAYLLCGGENGRLRAYAFDGRRWQDTFADAGYLPLWLPAVVTDGEDAVADWSAGGHSAPVWADFNADGWPDLVVGNAGGGLIWAYGMPYRALPLANETGGHGPWQAAAVRAAGPRATLYPNPAAETVTLQVETAVVYRLADLYGHLWRDGRLSAGSHVLPIADLPAGCYLLQVQSVVPSEGAADSVGPGTTILKFLKRR